MIVKLGWKSFEVVGPDEQVVAEDARPGGLRVGPNGSLVVRVRADETILDERLAARSCG